MQNERAKRCEKKRNKTNQKNRKKTENEETRSKGGEWERMSLFLFLEVLFSLWCFDSLS